MRVVFAANYADDDYRGAISGLVNLSLTLVGLSKI